VNEKGGISPEMAIRLSKAFGSTAETWLQMHVSLTWHKLERRETRSK
jgi:plasmid maintenance system antidote protein VapI